MKLSALVTFTLIASSCVQVTKENIVSGGKMSSEAPGVWDAGRDAFPKTIRISEAFETAGEVTSITNSMQTWETALGFNFFQTGTRVNEDAATVSNFRSLNDGVFGVYKLFAWPNREFGSSSLAVTQIFGMGYNLGTANAYNVIYHADIILNDTKSFKTATPGTTGFDLETVMLHEFGHFLGLEHTSGDKESSVMFASILTNEERRAPFSQDIAALRSKYNIGLGAQPTSNRYRPLNNDTGEEIHIIMQLQEDGECIHKVNGVEVQRHRVELK